MKQREGEMRVCPDPEAVAVAGAEISPPSAAAQAYEEALRRCFGMAAGYRAKML